MIQETEYAINRIMKVRKLCGTYRVKDSRIVGTGKHRRRRYTLSSVEGSGALLSSTEAFADEMDPLPDAAPADELALMPEPATQPQEHAAPAGHGTPAPEAEPAAPDAIRSRVFTPEQAFGIDAEPGTFGGELDEYSIGARYPSEPGELKNPYKPIRNFPENPTYQSLRGIVYNARFKGLEKFGTNQLAQLEDGTPIAVAVTHETNGHAIWVITTEACDELRRARLEVFYPNATGSSADAIEYAVLLALRQVPIRTEDLETLLLQL